MALDTNCRILITSKHSLVLHLGSNIMRNKEKKLERERKDVGSLLERETHDIRLIIYERSNPSHTWEGVFIVTVEIRSPESCGSGIQWVKTLPFSTVLLN
jgi:hypothetical protein